MNVAVVHDYFTQLGGAEKVAQEIYNMFPEASLYSTVALRSRMPEGLSDVEIHTSWMQKLPRMEKLYRLYFLLYPFAVSSLDLSSFDLVISSSSGYAKGVQTTRDAVHVCYCHNPMRWAWSFDSYSKNEQMSLFKRLLLPGTVRTLRAWDLGASRQPDHFIANSKTVAARIERAYGRTAKIIHPPIDINRFHPSSSHDDYYLVLARLVSYKHIDVAVEACTRLGRRLIIIGDGPDRHRLMSKAGDCVKFLGRLDDSEVEYYASRCLALLFPGEEDFGMAPLEIAAAGRPTIAYRAGGAIETIVEGETGSFFDSQHPDDLVKAILQFEKTTWSSEIIRQHAQGFGLDVFRERFISFLNQIGCAVPSRLSSTSIEASA